MIRTQKPILHNLNLKTIMRLSFQQYVSPFEAP